MKYRVIIHSPDGEEIDLVSGDDANFCKGALLGAQALLKLLQDDLDLEDGYSIQKVESSQTLNQSDTPFSQLFD